MHLQFQVVQLCVVYLYFRDDAPILARVIQYVERDVPISILHLGKAEAKRTEKEASSRTLCP